MSERRWGQPQDEAASAAPLPAPATLDAHNSGATESDRARARDELPCEEQPASPCGAIDDQAARDAERRRADEAGALVSLGHSLRERNDRAGALAAFVAAAERNPGNVAIRNEVAYLLRGLGRLDEAEATFRAMLRVAPKHGAALAGLGYISSERGDRIEALRLFEAARVADPARLDLKVEVGHELRALRRFDEAEAAYRDAIKDSPRHSGALMGLGHVLRERGDRVGALAAFEAAAETESQNLAIKNAIGYLLRDMKRLDESENAFRQILASAPAHLGALTGLGFVRGERGDREESLKAFEAAAAVDPRSPSIRIQIAHLLRQMHRLDEAEAMYRRVLDDEPKSAMAAAELGKLQKLRGDRASAIVTFNQALAILPAHAGLRVEFGCLLRDIGRIEEAEAAFRAVLAQEASNCAALCGLGWLMTDLHRLDEAESLFLLAVKANPCNVSCRLALGHLARRRGDRTASLVYFESALGVDPDNIDARLERAAELRDRGAFAEARAIVSPVLHAHPNHASAWLQLAQLDKVRGDAAGALQAVEAALRTNPRNPQLLVESAKMKQALGEPRAADALVRRALEEDPTHLGAFLQYADQATAAEDFGGARAIAQRAIEAHPRRPWPYLQAARACAELGEEAEVLELLDTARRMCGAQPEIVATRALLARQARDWPSARVALNESCQAAEGNFFLWTERVLIAIATGDHAAAEDALRAPPIASVRDEARVHLFRAQLLEAQRRYDEAVAEYGEAIRLDPSDSWAHAEMARASMIVLDLDAAVDRLRTSIQLNSSVHILRGQSLNASQHHLGQIIDEFKLDRGVAQALREANALPTPQKLERLCGLVRQNPGHTAPAMLLAIALRQGGLFGPSNRDGAAPGGAIPRRIVQFWDSGEPPADVRKLMQSWRERHPDFEYRLFDDESARSFVMRRLPIDVVRAFSRARHPAQRADIFRLAYLSAEGGFYVDADDRCLGSIETLSPPGTALMLYQENYGSIANDLMGAAPGHPVIARALAMVSQAMNRGDSDTLWLSTGPGLMTRAFAHCVAGLVPEIADWRPGTLVHEFGDLQRHVGLHCPARYKATDRHWSRAAIQQAAVEARRS
jgi:tetratricopeptide (TPR) repeat protein